MEIQAEDQKTNPITHMGTHACMHIPILKIFESKNIKVPKFPDFFVSSKDHKIFHLGVLLGKVRVIKFLVDLI